MLKMCEKAMEMLATQVNGSYFRTENDYLKVLNKNGV